MSTLRPDIAREFGDTAKTGDDTEAALERAAAHTPADDASAQPPTSEDELKETLRRQEDDAKS